MLAVNIQKVQEELLKCYELSDKITTSLATFETLISLSIDDRTVIDAKDYLQLMTHVRNIDWKMKVETEENFQKPVMDEIINLIKAMEHK